MRILLFFISVFSFSGLVAQQDNLTQSDSIGFEAEVLAFQKQLNEDYSMPETSPLPQDLLDEFTGHDFFPIDSSYRIVARFEKAEVDSSIHMSTSSERMAEYIIYGFAHFELDSKAYSLVMYQSVRLLKMDADFKYLFLPFNDHTNGVDSYGGGRYIDLLIPNSETVVIDFNQAYHPYCAYTDGYSCPVPPPENKLDRRIEAGIRLTDTDH